MHDPQHDGNRHPGRHFRPPAHEPPVGETRTALARTGAERRGVLRDQTGFGGWAAPPVASRRRRMVATRDAQRRLRGGVFRPTRLGRRASCEGRHTEHDARTLVQRREGLSRAHEEPEKRRNGPRTGMPVCWAASRYNEETPRRSGCRAISGPEPALDSSLSWRRHRKHLATTDIEHGHASMARHRVRDS